MRHSFTFFLILVSVTLSAQTTRKYSNEFLNIGVDAAAFGMGNAVTALSNDVNSGYWNPAGLVNINDWEVSGMHASYFANIANYDYLAVAKPLDNESAIGFSVIRFGVDDILNTTQLIDDQGNINLRMTCHVNDKLISDGNTNDLYHSFGDMIERASLNTNLIPGDYIGSGTVGTGCILELRPENTDGWIEKGDTVTLTVERLGSLENKIV